MPIWKDHRLLGSDQGLLEDRRAAPEREGIRWLTSRKATDWQYSNGVKDLTLVDPDAATVDQALLDRPGNQEIQLDLFYDYRTNLPLYPALAGLFPPRQAADAGGVGQE